MRSRHSETGNVLFIILIAVALFAALSFAVSQSSRSGNADISKEQMAIGVAALNQYVTAIRTQVMLLRGRGIGHPDFSDFSNRFERAADGHPRCVDTPEECVFKNVPYYASGYRLRSVFDVGFEDEPSPGGMVGRVDVIDGRYYSFLVLRGMKGDACASFNAELDIATVREVDKDDDLDALDVTELQTPIQCVKNLADDNYFLLVPLYESDTV